MLELDYYINSSKTITMLDKKPIIGITLGDFNGIGPETIIKVLSDVRINKLFTPVVYGHSGIFAQYRKLLGVENFGFNKVNDELDNLNFKKPNIKTIWDNDYQITPGEPTTESSTAALSAIKTAAIDLKNGKLHGVVTAPISKEHIKKIQPDFIGHTELFTNLYDDVDSLMFLVSDRIKTATLTGHIPLVEVSSNLSRKKIVAKAKILIKTLEKDFNITKPRIAILGLNPHASDNGAIGNEEQEFIIPAIQNLKESDNLVYGPYPADGFFGAGTYEKFDAVLGMYHDQVLTPFKTIAFDDGVNFTAGLPIVRTSPDHGTAFDIAGKNKANETSLRQAIFTTIDIIKNRRVETIKS